MNEARQPHIDEFKAICRAEFSFLIADFGFTEVPPPTQQYANPFEVHFTKNSGRLIAEGLSYGFSAAVDVQSPSGERAHFHYLVPEDFWATHREGLGRGQPGDLRYWALCVRTFGGAFLQGDWSGHAYLVAQGEEWRRTNRLEQERHSRELDAQRAVDASLPLFQTGDYAGVVRLLAPHEDCLSRAQRLRLQIARQRA